MNSTPPGSPRDNPVSGLPSDLIANHLFLADYLSDWASDLRNDNVGREQPRDEIDFLLGYQRALEELAEHLRAGDGLPGGPLQLSA